MREHVVLADVITQSRLERADLNPAGTHALRSSFSTILEREKVDPDIINGMIGHEVSYNGAYTNCCDEELMKIYQDNFGFLTVFSDRKVSDMEKPVQEMKQELSRIPKLEKTLEYVLLKLE